MTLAPEEEIELYPNPILISLIGIGEEQDSGYTVDRTLAGGEYLFEYIGSPVTLADSRGSRRFESGVFIFLQPGQRLFFRAEAPFVHTWFHLSGTGVAECISAYGIPVNEAHESPHLYFLAPLLENAKRQMARNGVFVGDAVTEVGRSFFRRIARVLNDKEPAVLSPYQKDLITTLHRVRAQVFKDFRRRWAVDEMAALANLSPTRFAVVYRMVYGASPIDDLIEFRLRHADLLLRLLPISISEAAEHSGFSSLSNFHVVYREKVGRSPRTRHKTTPRLEAGSSFVEGAAKRLAEAQRVEFLYTSPIGYWSFDQLGDVVHDDLGKHPVGVSKDSIVRIPGRDGGSALYFEFTQPVIVPEAVIDTSLSYTVSALLKHDREGRMTAISIGAAEHGAFYLQYITVDGGFKFATTISEQDCFAICAEARTPSLSGVWYHVAGVHDQTKKEIRLYVNGKLESATHYATAWRTEGSTYFGACYVMHDPLDLWVGGIDEVRIYDRALSDSEILMLNRHLFSRRVGETQKAVLSEDVYA